MTTSKSSLFLEDDSNATLRYVEELASSFRHVRGNENYDAQGIRVIWHQGRGRTEMLSWENKNSEIVRQELTLAGLTVEFRSGQRLRTGIIPHNPEATDSGQPKAHLIQMDPAPSNRTLRTASCLLREMPHRDYYAQHLLKHVNECINSLSSNDERTTVSELEQFKRSEAPQHRAFQDQDIKHKKKWAVPFFWLLAPVSVATALLFWYLRR